MTKQDFIDELLKNHIVRIGESIDYSRFCEIYANYSHIPETQFAALLGITIINLMNIKHRGQHTIILKELLPAYEKQIEAEIQEDVLRHFEPGQQITYEQFTKLRTHYSGIYGELTDTKLGKFLEIPHDALTALRSSGVAFLLKSKYSAQTMAQTLIEEGLVTPGDKITYPTFLSTFETAKQKHASLRPLSQYAFAYLLGFNNTSFANLKAGRISSFQILKKYIPSKPILVANVSPEERDAIVQDLMQRCHAKPYELCNLARFQELHQGYEYISDRQFAFLLGLTEKSYYSIRYGRNGRILKDYFSKEAVVLSLLENKKVTPSEQITYAKLMELYQEYSELDLSTFMDLLEIPQRSLRRLKADDTATVTVLKSRTKPETPVDYKKEAETYVNTLFQAGKIHLGQEISYADFQSLYSSCSAKIPQYQFASLLGINYSCYQNMRYNRSKTYIHDAHTKEAVSLIGKIEQQRFYSEEEITAICEQYHISVADFIQYVMHKGRFTAHIQAYLSVLSNHHRLYIGKTQMSRTYFEQIYSIHANSIKNYVHTLCKNSHTLKDYEDYLADAFLYIFETCGDMEHNLADYRDQDSIQRMILARVKAHLLPKLFNQMHVQLNTKSANTFYTNRTKESLDIPDSNAHVEASVFSSLDDERQEAEVMRRNYSKV